MTATATRTGRAHNGEVAIGYEVHDRADGPWVVLVQGLGYARWGWGPLTDHLAARFRLVLPDNRGIGASDVPPGPYSAAGMAEDVVAVLDEVGIERASIVGLSLGGMIAQELAIDHAHRVDRLGLLATTPGVPHAHPIPEATLQLIAEAARLPPHEALPRLVANALAPATVDDRPELVAEIVALRLANPPDPAGWQAQAAAGTSYVGGDRHAAITAPTLVVHGDADRVIDVRNAALLANLIDGARLEIVAGGGHLLPLEHPDRLARLLADHLTGEGR